MYYVITCKCISIAILMYCVYNKYSKNEKYRIKWNNECFKMIFCCIINSAKINLPLLPIIKPPKPPSLNMSNFKINLMFRDTMTLKCGSRLGSVKIKSWFDMLQSSTI